MLGCLKNKLDEIRYESERILISKNPKKIGFILIRRFPGQAMYLGQFAMCQSALQECQQALLGAKPAFSFGSIWTPFLKIFLAENCT